MSERQYPDSLRGHPIEYVGGEWRYVDDGTPTVGSDRSCCGKCGQHRTPEGHDACVGTIPGAMNACCGHGQDNEAYIQFFAAERLSGVLALEAMKRAVEEEK